MLLNKLLDRDLAEIEISDITCDSREVKPGSVFFALSGVNSDGADYIESAIEKGASAIVVRHEHKQHSSLAEESKLGESFGGGLDVNPEKTTKQPTPKIALRQAQGTILTSPQGRGINIIHSDNPRAEFSKACFNFYGAKQPEKLITVTGTNGKTSIANFARQIWQLLGYESASIGTIGVVTKDSYEYGDRTTPGSKELYKQIADLTDMGISHLAIEASSHGIIQNRLDDLTLEGAGFTNLTPEHLDYHKDMESYYQAKARLFSEILPKGKTAVLNADTEQFARLKETCLNKGQTVIGYGENGDEIKIVNTTPLAHGQEILFNFFGKEHSVQVELVGSFQASNLACALGLVVATNPELIENSAELMAVLPKLKGVDGRMELVGQKDNGANVYVDYAHSPDGLDNMLRAIRPHVHNGGRLVCVFGCGGDRDKTKRPVMGRLANDLADIAIIADDNPRTEDPVDIREAIAAACPKGVNIGDRAKAILDSIDMLKSDDLLIIAGKGHEIGQEINGVITHFNDKEEVLKHLSIKTNKKENEINHSPS